MDILVYEKDGGVSECFPSPNYKARMMKERQVYKGKDKNGKKTFETVPAMTEEEFYEHLSERVCGGAPVNRKKHEDLPDEYFRKAWKLNGSNVEVDMPMAREIHMNEIRKLRTPKLEEADRAVQIAEHAGDNAKKATEAAKRQALRDIPQKFDLSVYATPEELKAAIPEELV